MSGLNLFGSQLFDPDILTKMLQFTPTLHRDVYPAVDPKNPAISAAGKSVLITGGGRGVGKGIAFSWASAGASSIIITGRNEKTLQSTTEALKKASSTTKVLAIPCDVTSETAVANLISTIKHEVGKLDVLICNVGGSLTLHSNPKLGEGNVEDWWGDMEWNLKGTYLCMHYYLKSLDPSSPTGTIIASSSGAAGACLPGQSSYSLAKRAIAGLVEYVAKEYSSVRAFSLSPGIVKTADHTDFPKDFEPFAKDTLDLVGGTTLWLTTEKANFLSGRWLSVNWDVEEMEKHKEEIEGKGLLKMGWLKAELGPPGHPFGK